MYIAFARKYRPQTWAQVMGQDHVTRTLANAVAGNRIHHAYLLCGARGIGKTTIARLLAKTINCTGPAPKDLEPCNACPSCLEITNGSSLDVQEIDGASNTSVDDVREIRERVKFLPASGKYKVYIIDEVHMLSTSAFNALLKTLEEPPAHVIFIFATTESQKIPATILSRCQRFDLRRLPHAMVVAELDKIAAQEGVTLDAVAASIIARESEGSMRDAQSLLDQAVAFGSKAVDAKVMENLLGLCDRAAVIRVLNAMIARDAAILLSHAEELFASGVHLVRFLQDVLTDFRHLWVIKTCGKPVAMEDVVPEEVAALQALVEKVSAEEIQQFVRILTDGVERVARSRSPRIAFETLLLQTTLIQPVVALDTIMAKLDAMEGAPRHSRPSSPQGTSGRGDPAVQAQDPSSRNSGVTNDWDTLLSRLQQDKPQIASILSHSLRHAMTANGLSIMFPKGSVYADMIKESDRQNLLKQLMAKYFGKPMTLDVAIDDAQSVEVQIQAKQKEREVKREEKRTTTTEALQHHLVKEAMSILQAEVIEVKTK